MESNAEPWFPDARVKTCVTIMRRCADEPTRLDTQVKFVQLKKPLAEIIGVPATGDEPERQKAAQRLREEIESTPGDTSNSRMRITAAVIPDATPAHLSSHAKMFDNETVYFGPDRKSHVICKSREEAEFIKLLADLGVNGTVNVPAKPTETADLKQRIEDRVQPAKSRFEELAAARTGLEEKQREVVELLLRWFVLGRPTMATASQ